MEASNSTFKNFNFCWRIDNFQYNTEKVIQSTTISIPPFSGVFWCLRVKLLDPGNVKSFDCYLHRIPSDPGPEFIFVTYTIQVTGTSVLRHVREFRNANFLNVDTYPPDNPTFSLNVEVIDFPKHTSDLVINCEIHRYNVEQSYTTSFYYKNSMSLSNDMLALNNNRFFTDLSLVVQRHVFLTHKAILDARLPLIGKVFNINYATKSEIELFGIAPSVIEYLLHYAYTGSLHVDSYNHLQALHNLAVLLELVDLQRLMHTTANKCLARTTMNIQKKSFTWIMNQVLPWISGEDMVAIILSHNIAFARILNVSWGPVEYDSTLFLSFKFQFSLMLVDHPIFMRCNFRITAENSLLHAGTFHTLFRSNAVWSTGPLIAKNVLDGYDMPITFHFELELCDGEAKACIEESESEIAFPLPVSRNIEKLSYDLQSLFATENFSDVTLITPNKMKIKAHRAILAPRSKTFHTLIKKYMSPDNCLQIRGVSNEALLFVLHYMYTGRAKDLNSANVQEFNIAAKYFQLYELISETKFYLESMNLPL